MAEIGLAGQIHPENLSCLTNPPVRYFHSPIDALCIAVLSAHHVKSPIYELSTFGHLVFRSRLPLGGAVALEVHRHYCWMSVDDRFNDHRYVFVTLQPIYLY